MRTQHGPRRMQDMARKREAQKVLAELRGRVQLLSAEQERAALQRLLGPDLAAATVRAWFGWASLALLDSQGLLSIAAAHAFRWKPGCALPAPAACLWVA